MVLSNVAERCVTVGGGARVGSRAFTERGLPSSSPLSAESGECCFFPGAGSRRQSRRCDRRARASPRVRARVRGSSLGDASPITQLDFRCVSRPRVLPNGETFPDRTKLGVKVNSRFGPKVPPRERVTTLFVWKGSLTLSFPTLSRPSPTARAVREKNRPEYRTGGGDGEFSV